MNPEDFNELPLLLNSAQNILILVGQNPTLDNLGGGLALYLALTRAGKKVNIVCPQPPTVDLSNLVGIDKVKTELGGQSLTLTFPYTEGSIEKVSYNIEENKFNLIIQPREGFEPLSPEAVRFSSGGGAVELIFVLGTPTLTDLGPLYEKGKEIFGKTPLVVIDNHPENKHYGKINFVNPNASSVSEIMATVLKKLGLEMDSDTAHNLLTGIEFATASFSSPSTSFEAFETAGACLRVGARRGLTFGKTATKSDLKPKASPLPSVSPSLGDEETPSDWLTPKIFKGSGLP